MYNRGPLLLIKNRSIQKNLTVVIRGVNERTEAQCKNLLVKQISKKNIHVVHKEPFRAALEESYRIGIKADRKWTMVIDADVLICTGLISKLYSKAENAPNSVFVILTEMIDKFFGGKRVGGVKVYRTKLLPEALKIVPESDVRPEAFVIKNMHKKDFYVDIIDLICGLHDYEQYYSDIFRKGYVHGVKHAAFAKTLLSFWKRQASSDLDFAVLLAGYTAASKHSGALQLAKDESRNYFTSYMKLSGIKEKDALDNDINVNSIIDNLSPPSEYYEVKKEIDKMGRPSVPKNAK